MSDPIAAAEAAGKARDIANRFETAVFLIAYGIAEKDGLYEADPHRYPYSQAFRHGMNILAALCAECSDDAEELLPTFNESDFIRNSAASDVREWTARWRDECREAVEGCRSIEIGPLASVDGDYFAATSECYEYADVHVFHCASVRMRNCVCVRVCVCAIAEPTGAYRNRACPDPGECCRS